MWWYCSTRAYSCATSKSWQQHLKHCAVQLYRACFLHKRDRVQSLEESHGINVYIIQSDIKGASVTPRECFFQALETRSVIRWKMNRGRCLSLIAAPLEPNYTDPNKPVVPIPLSLIASLQGFWLKSGDAFKALDDCTAPQRIFSFTTSFHSQRKKFPCRYNKSRHR